MAKANFVHNGSRAVMVPPNRQWLLRRTVAQQPDKKSKSRKGPFVSTHTKGGRVRQVPSLEPAAAIATLNRLLELDPPGNGFPFGHQLGKFSLGEIEKVPALALTGCEQT